MIKLNRFEWEVPGETWRSGVSKNIIWTSSSFVTQVMLSGLMQLQAKLRDARKMLKKFVRNLYFSVPKLDHWNGPLVVH